MQEKKTLEQYDPIIRKSKEIFRDKMQDYGCSWRVLRPSSLTDQLYIKAKRIRTIQEKGTSKVEEGVVPEFYGIINYGVMALVQLDLGVAEQPDLSVDRAVELYEEKANAARDLMLKKNHDYGEAWRDMRISSLADMIMVKLMRIRRIEENEGVTIASEGADSNYFDMINYAIFALIKLKEKG